MENCFLTVYHLSYGLGSLQEAMGYHIYLRQRNSQIMYDNLHVALSRLRDITSLL
jgi:hypothetical protein